MGESQYGNEEDRHANVTISVMRALALPEYRFFDTLLAIVTDGSAETLGRQKEWARLAFSNFVQTILPEDDRRPGTADWQSGRDAFFGQLALTRPKQLLVVGRQQWEQLPSVGYMPVPPFKFDGRQIENVGIYAYDVNGEVAFTVATCIYHPSSRGRLKIPDARRQLRAVEAISCNLLSAMQRDDEGWYYEDTA